MENEMKITVINGPNLNLLGKRDPVIYGNQTYDDLVLRIQQKAFEKKCEAVCLQSNQEGVLIDLIQATLADGTNGLIINPGAYGHYSYGIRDALELCSFPKIEVHISKVYQRESFRQMSVIAPVCDGQIIGLGIDGYELAMEALLWKLRDQKGIKA